MCHIHMPFEHFQGWGFHDLHGQPVPMPDYPFSEEIFPNIQSKSPHVQLKAISSCSVTYDLEEDTRPQLTMTFFQVVVEGKVVVFRCCL